MRWFASRRHLTTFSVSCRTSISICHGQRFLSRSRMRRWPPHRRCISKFPPTAPHPAPALPHRAAADYPLQRNMDGGGAGVACSWPIGRSIEPALSRVCNAIRPPVAQAQNLPEFQARSAALLPLPSIDGHTEMCCPTTRGGALRHMCPYAVPRYPPPLVWIVLVLMVLAGGATFHIARPSCADQPFYSETGYCLRCCADSCCCSLLPLLPWVVRVRGGP